MGTDGYTFLAALYAPQAPPWFRDIPAVETLRRVWVQQFYLEAGQVRWRTEKEGIPPSGLFISSPYDVEARYAKKQTTSWVGYKVHVTETCDDDAPHLITHVETTAGPVADGEVTPRIHQALERKDVLPATHIVDTGYLDAELLVTSQRDYGITLLGPTRANDHWQAQAAQGFDASSFAIDWDQRQARCPCGHLSASCQVLAQNTHPYTSPEKGRKALLERLCQGMQRIAVDTDHPPMPPPDDPWHGRPFLQQPHQAIAL